jgi:hypothetical protein
MGLQRAAEAHVDTRQHQSIVDGDVLGFALRALDAPTVSDATREASTPRCHHRH